MSAIWANSLSVANATSLPLAHTSHGARTARKPVTESSFPEPRPMRYVDREPVPLLFQPPPRALAEACAEEAKRAGLERVRLGNVHLLW